MVYRIKREDGTTDQQAQNEEQWAQNTLREVLLAAYQEQKRARMWRNIWRVVGLLVFLAMLAGLRGGMRQGEQARESASRFAHQPHTAVVKLTGEIGGSEQRNQVDILREGMQAAYRNPNAKAIIIHANSPGGVRLLYPISPLPKCAECVRNTKTFLCMWWRKICVLRVAITSPQRLTRFLPTRLA